MSNILPILNLNKQPTSVKDRILVDAENIRFEKDGKTITNINDIEVLTVSYIEVTDDGEKIIKENNILNALFYLANTYCRTDSEIEDKISGTVSISHILPCNNELVIFCGYHISKEIDEQIISEVRNPIFRYNEKENLIKLNYTDYGSNVSTHNMSSTFTYNYNNELIIAFCEYGLNDDYPLKVVNLGKWEEIDDYKQINKNLLPIAPKILSFSANSNTTSGVLYKGQYTFFVRFKISDIDYSPWYDLNCNILLDAYTSVNIFDYSLLKARGKKTKEKDEIIKQFTAFDYMSDEFDTINNSITINTNFNNQKLLNITNYQLAFICTTKTNKIVKKTEDINIDCTSYVFDRLMLYDYSENLLISNYINYFNVKKLYNYNNKLYIADYKEQHFQHNEVNADIIIKDIKNGYDDTTGTVSLDFSTFKQDNFKTYKCILPKKKKTVISNETTNRYINNDFKYDGGVPFIYLLSLLEINKFVRTNFSLISNTTLRDKWLSICDKKIEDIENDNDFIVDVIKVKADSVDDFTYPTVGQIGLKKDTTTQFIQNINIAKLFIKILDNGKVSFYPKNEQNNNILLETVDNDDFVVDDSTYYNIGNSYSNLIIIIKNKGDNAILTKKTIGSYEGYLERRGFVYDNNLPKYKIIEFTPYTKPNIDKYYSLIGIPKGGWPKRSITNIPGAGNNAIMLSNLTYKSDNIKIDESGLQHNSDSYFETNTYYEFFIHYIDDYHNISLGYPIKLNSNDENITIDNNIVKINSVNKDIKNIEFNNITGINYNNFFISYSYKKRNTYKGIIKRIDTDTYLFYCADLILEDKINLNLNKINIYETNKTKIKENIPAYITTERAKNETVVYEDYSLNEAYENNNLKIKGVFDITSANIEQSNIKNLYNSLAIKLIINTEQNIDECLAEIYNDEPVTILSISDKKLIPCSLLLNNKTQNIELINGNAYRTLNSAIIFTNNIYFNSGSKVFDDIEQNGIPVAAGIAKSLNTDEMKWSNKADILLKYEYCDIQNIPYEYKQFHHKPSKIMFPGVGSDSTTVSNENFISYIPGQIFESINVIDLYKNIHLPITEAYAKYYTNYREDVIYLSEFTKTIRRSNIIRNESRELSWRFFEPNQYKMISENKGKITNIVGFGDILLVHTEHSLFMFRNQYSLESDKNEQIALQNNDIWDLKYKEVVTDQLGYAGLQDNSSYIAGQFGYIFYDKDAKTIYQFDEGKFNNISTDIENYIRQHNMQRINFTEDKEHNIIYCATETKVLIYDYINKSFVSKLNLSKMNYYFYGFNTKQKAYFIDNDYRNVATISKNTANKATFSVIVNTSIETIKYIESIKYKLRLFNDNSVIDEGLFRKAIHPYSGEILQIQSEFCDTDNIDITVNADAIANNYPENNCIESSTGRYDKPYFHLGQWNFNTIRDTINRNDYGQEQSRVYGDWFIITFKFNNLQTTKNKKRKLEFESLTVNLIEAK